MSYENTSPCGCNSSSPCGCKISSDDVVYQGPNLGCTDIVTCDSITQAIQKLDEYACSIDLVQNIITNITNNISLYNQFVTIVNQSVDCSTVFDCLVPTTTTTTTTLTCTCIEIIIGQDDLDQAIGNSNGELNNVVFLSSPASGAVLCTGGLITNAFNEENAYKFCITASAFPLLQLYYYKNDSIITGPELVSLLINLEQDCSVTGDCDE
jgi:hypothetical protein